MSLASLPTTVLLLLAYSQLGEPGVRAMLCDALAACAGSEGAVARAMHVSAALAACSKQQDGALERLLAMLAVPTKSDDELIHQLRDALSTALALGEEERADAIRDALKDASEGVLFWQSSAKGLLVVRIAPSLVTASGRAPRHS